MEELRRLRQEAGLSQAQLARESGVDRATINKIEQGKRSPSMATLESLARAMKAEVGDFFPKAQAPLPLESPEAGPSEREGRIFDVVRDLAYKQARQNAQAANRALESDQLQTYFMRHDNDAMDFLLGLARGEVEEAYIELMHAYIQLEYENSRRREEAEVFDKRPVNAE